MALVPGFNSASLHRVFPTKLLQLRPCRDLSGRTMTQMHYARIVRSREDAVAVINIPAPRRVNSKTVTGNSVFTLRLHGDHS
jgi:hypothetical protein